ncbi:MAG: SusC/RagA family TonB-linked outer membrane protein, partial [Segetibacter sp.]
MKYNLPRWRSTFIIPLIFLAFILHSTHSNAQGNTSVVKGVVQDKNNEPLPGVSVIIKNTKTNFTSGTSTDSSGIFTFPRVTPGGPYSFTFSTVGHETQTLSGYNIKETVTLSLALNMTPTAAALDQVVVVGYGTQKKRDLTGAVSTVKAKSIENERPQNIQDILRGNVAGIQTGGSMTAKGGGSLELRGKNTLKTNSSPLIVLDGVIYPGAMEDINPNDIETIDVLKDASSAAVFGSRAANGVIMVTTKKGSLGKPIINFNGSNGIATVGTMAKLYQAHEFLDWRQEVMKSKNRYNPSTSNKLFLFENPNNLPSGVTMDMWLDGSTGDPQDIWLSRIGLLSLEKANYAAGKSVNWADMVFRNGLRQDYNLSVSGKKSEVSYFWSLGYNKNQGIVVGDDYSAVRSRINLDAKVTNWFTAGLNLQYSNRDESAIPVDWASAEYNSPWGSIYKDDGVTLRLTSTEDVLNTNPIYARAFQDRKASYNTIISSLYTEFKLPLGITYRATFSPRFEFHKYMNHQSAKHETWALFGGQVNRNQQETYSWQLDNLIKWNKTIKDIHKVDITLLVNAEKFQSWRNEMSIQGFSPTDALGYSNVSAGRGTTTVTTADDQYETGDALMARGFYSLRDKYMLTLSVRRDGYSAFGYNHPRGVFPSAAFGWVFTDEKFLKNDILTYGKLRLSWGENGNRDVGRYSALSAMGLGRYAYQPLSGSVYESNLLFVNTMANADLKWERTRSVNAGLDFSIKNGLLDGSIEVYKSSTLDLLVDRALPDVLGVRTVVSNLGEVSNKGIEMTLNARIMNNKNFKWRSGFTFSLNRNKIVHLYGDMVDVLAPDGTVIGQKEGDDITNKWFIGRAIDEIWDPVVLGVWQVGEKGEAAKQGQFPGDFKIKDVDKSGTINYVDHEFQGYRVPRYQWNMRHDFNIYKNFDLSFAIYSQWGHKGTFNNAKNNDRLYPDRFNSYIVHYWTPENPMNDWA